VLLDDLSIFRHNSFSARVNDSVMLSNLAVVIENDPFLFSHGTQLEFSSSICKISAFRLGDAMADPAAYTWYAAYQTAVLGTEPGWLGSRIDAAFASIQERLNWSSAVDDAERHEIEDALLVLHALRAEIGL
jgi:hypothetical protein